MCKDRLCTLAEPVRRGRAQQRTLGSQTLEVNVTRKDLVSLFLHPGVAMREGRQLFCGLPTAGLWGVSLGSVLGDVWVA